MSPFDKGGFWWLHLKRCIIGQAVGLEQAAVRGARNAASDGVAAKLHADPSSFFCPCGAQKNPAASNLHQDLKREGIRMNAYATHNGVTGSDYLHRPCANVPRLGPSVRRNCSEGFSSPPNTGSQLPPACLKMGSSLLSSSKHFVYELVAVSIAPALRMATVSHQFFSKCGRSVEIDRVAAR